jgi:hypothetical protein
MLMSILDSLKAQFHGPRNDQLIDYSRDGQKGGLQFETLRTFSNSQAYISGKRTTLRLYQRVLLILLTGLLCSKMAPHFPFMASCCAPFHLFWQAWLLPNRLRAADLPLRSQLRWDRTQLELSYCGSTTKKLNGHYHWPRVLLDSAITGISLVKYLSQP